MKDKVDVSNIEKLVRDNLDKVKSRQFLLSPLLYDETYRIVHKIKLKNVTISIIEKDGKYFNKLYIKTHGRKKVKITWQDMTAYQSGNFELLINDIHQRKEESRRNKLQNAINRVEIYNKKVI